jgi:hypothetical protein
MLGSTTPIADALSTPKNTTQLTIARIAIDDRFQAVELFVGDEAVMFVSESFPSFDSSSCQHQEMRRL